MPPPTQSIPKASLPQTNQLPLPLQQQQQHQLQLPSTPSTNLPAQSLSTDPASSNPLPSQKGKAKASFSKLPPKPSTLTPPKLSAPPPTSQATPQLPPASIKQPKSRRPTTLATDVFASPDPPLSPTIAVSAPSPLSPSSQLPLSHQPAPSQQPKVAIDDLEDDEVLPIDRGEALVRRRMKERHRLKKEAERRQRRADDDARQPRPPGSTSAHVRPSASRTRTAPAHPHTHHHTLSGSQRDHSLASPSLESFWPRDRAREDDPGRTASMSPDAHARPPAGLHLDTGRSADPSPVRVTSTYQSFGSPSQFKSKPSAEHPAPAPAINVPLSQPLTLPGSNRSSFSYAARPVPTIQADATAAPDVEDEPEYEYGSQTPRGRPRPMRTVSVRSASTAALSVRRAPSQYSLGPPPSVDSRDSHSVHEDGSVVDQSNGAEDDELDEDAEPSGGSEDDGGSLSSPGPEGDDVEYTLKDRQDAINIEHPFGLPIWKPALYKKSRSVARNAEAALHNSPTSSSVSTLTFGNVLWTVLFGSWLAVTFGVVAGVLFVIPWGGSKYGRVVWELAGYLVWPFGKYVEEWSEEEEEDGQAQDERVEEAARPARYGHTAGHSSRWVAVSEIDEEENDSFDRLTIRGVGEHTGLAAIARAAALPDYGATSREAKDRHTSTSTVASDLAAMLGYFKGEGEGAKGPLRVRALGRLSYWAAYYLIIAPLMLMACLLCWFFVFTIPMAKLLWVLVRHVGTEPLALHFRSPPTYIDLDLVESGLAQQTEGGARPSGSSATDTTHSQAREPPQLKPGQPAPKHSKKSLSASRAKGRLVSGNAKVLLCTYKALGVQYYKYTLDGVNIMFIILMPFVIFVIFDAFVLAPLKIQGGLLGMVSSQGFIFVLALLSVIPLSYFIGMAVASISAQSSIGMGAVINATFGSIIEILLYGIALTEGKGDLVEGSIIGSVLAGVLLMPGLSMIGGSVRRKEQKFNARSAGVTSTMLIMAIIGTLTPTLFYEIYGTFQLTCSGCPEGVNGGNGTMWQCKSCRYEHLSPVSDPFYQSSVKGLSYYCAILLVLSYLIGLWFSLRTHASQIWQTPAASVPVAAPAHHLVVDSLHNPVTAPGADEHATNQQRVSMYVRRLPEIVKQQLLPHVNRGASGQHQGGLARQVSLATIGGGDGARQVSGGEGKATSTAEGSGGMPRTLTTEEVNQTLEVLEMASAGRLPPGSSREALGHGHGHKVPTHLAHPHSREASRSLSSAHYHSLTMPAVLGSLGAPVAAAAAGALGELHDDGGGGHDAPNWSRNKSTTVLLTCTLLYAVIAEILVSVVDVVLDGSGIPEKLLGVTLFALVPNTTEFMNAISFAINGNIALSMEIGSAYALQVCLIQIPAMILISAIYNSGLSVPVLASHAFTLVFPRWDVISIMFSVFLLTYTYIEARANYYRGTILVLSYLVLIGGFYSAPVDSLDMVKKSIDSSSFVGGGYREKVLSVGWDDLTLVHRVGVWAKSVIGIL